jgi:hypothetical protein
MSEPFTCTARKVFAASCTWRVLLTTASAAAADFLFRFRKIVRPRPRPSEVARTRDRLARFAWLLDSAFRVPGTNIRVGLEPLLGFVPGIGDALGKALSLYLVYEAWRLGVPAPLLLRMIGNVAVDTLIGAVPVVGDLGDVFWRANRMNIALLDAYLASAASTAATESEADGGGAKVIDGEWRRLD